jgi:hypothetical protein
MPRSPTSAASSGGVRSSVSFTAATIRPTGGSSARRTSSALIVTRRSSPDTRSRPATVVSALSSCGQADPTSSFAASAVSWPIRTLCEFFT